MRGLPVHGELGNLPRMYCSFKTYGRGIAVLAMAGLITLSPPAGAETLQDALALAYTNNPALQAERAKLRSVDEGVPEAL